MTDFAKEARDLYDAVHAQILYADMAAKVPMLAFSATAPMKDLARRMYAAGLAEGLAKAAEIARPLEEWHEGIGDVLWWAFPIAEPPYVGTPLDLGHTVEIHTNQGVVARGDVGGWPGYHTHWTPLRLPADPGETILSASPAPAKEEPEFRIIGRGDGYVDVMTESGNVARLIPTPASAAYFNASPAPNEREG